MERNDRIKDYYKVSEIAISLRDYLQEGYRILYKMLSLININSSVPYKAEIKIIQESATNLFSEHIIYKDEPYKGMILLFISKVGFSPLRIIRNYKTRFIEEESPLYSIDNADFIIENKDGEFVFKERYEHNLPHKYRPNLSILDKDKFLKLYQKLEMEGYLTNPAITFFNKGTPDFSFSLSSQRISLEEIQSNNKSLWISYDPCKDLLLVKDNRKNPKLTINQMLNLLIPKEEIYKGYVSILEKNMNNLDNTLLDLKSKEEQSKRLIKRY